LGIGRCKRTAGAKGGEWVLDVEVQEEGEGFNTENTGGAEKEKENEALNAVVHNL
jgi:hypothetical protein